jgi:hypothetical protein
MPNVPVELFEQSYDDHNLDARRNRLGLLFSYFRASTAEELALAMAASMFPAFRPRSAQRPKLPGRRPSIRPKYEVLLLMNVAAAYGSTKRRVKSTSAAPPSRIYGIFRKEHPRLANQLQVRGNPLKLGSFKKLLTVGRLALKQEIVWYKDLLEIFTLETLPLCEKRFGEYIAVNPSATLFYLRIPIDLTWMWLSLLGCNTMVTAILTLSSTYRTISAGFYWNIGPKSRRNDWRNEESNIWPDRVQLRRMVAQAS